VNSFFLLEFQITKQHPTILWISQSKPI